MCEGVSVSVSDVCACVCHVLLTSRIDGQVEIVLLTSGQEGRLKSGQKTAESGAEFGQLALESRNFAK